MNNYIWTTIALLLASLFLLYKYFTRNFDYWKKRNVYFLKPSPFWGNFWDVMSMKLTTGDWLKSLYNKTNEPYFGIFIFDRPVLVLRSPELVKLILQKDFNMFDNRSVVTPEHDPVTRNMLFLAKNPGWKVLRQKSTPIFTSGKLKKMFPHIDGVGSDLTNFLRKNATDESMEAKNLAQRFSTDVITKCAFGVDAKSFENENHGFRKVGQLMFDFRLKTAVTQLSSFFAPGIAKFFKFNFFDEWIVSFLKESLTGVIKIRQDSNARRNDLIDLLVDIKKDPSANKKIFDDDALLSIAMQFFAAGFETTSSVISFSLYELCINPNYQKKLREEIRMTLKENNGQLNYEAVMGMKYLDMVVCETLRMYPVLPFLDRVANADYKVPGYDLVIKKGTYVYVPMTGLHFDEKYFPNPEKFNPERFVDKTTLNQEGFTYIPFGEGPRVCIGERFGLLGTKLGLIHVLSEFEVQQTQDTPLPLEFEPRSFLLQSKVGLPMRFKRANAPSA